MALKRSQIQMTDDEIATFLSSSKTMSLATLERDGAPHQAAMWFCLVGGSVVFWTFRKSQKAVNLIRDPRASILVESGETYSTLKGVQISCKCSLIDGEAEVREVGRILFKRYFGSEDTEENESSFMATANKRVAFRAETLHIASWDHGKLIGGY